MEAVAQAHTVAQAHLHHGGAGGFERGAGGGAGHEDDALLRQVQGFDGGPVFLALHYEFEPGGRQGDKVCQRFRHVCFFARVAGVDELGGDIPLIDAPGERRGGGDGAVCLDFHMHAFGEQGEQAGEGRLLEQGLPACYDKGIAVKIPYMGGHIMGGAEYAVSPRMLGITPLTGQVAACKPQEDCRGAAAGAFSLQGVKYLGG